LPFVTQIRRLFRDSPIIRIVRDPRDVALSLKGMPWGPDTFIGGLRRWLMYDAASDAFFRRDRNVVTLRFEDLITAPERTVRYLCSFLGEDFESSMLDTRHAEQSVNRTLEPWKAKAALPIDPTRVAIWRDVLSPLDNRLAESLCGNRLRTFNYDVVATSDKFCDAYPIEALFTEEDTARALACKGFRFWKSDRRERPSVLLFIGHPDANRWFSGSRWRRVRTAILLAVRIGRAVVLGRRICWVHAREKGAPLSKCGLLVSLCLMKSQGALTDGD
jgi:Sulfotransferase family